MAGRIGYQGNIVTQGLVLNLDAGIKGSYPGTGSVWNDISGNGITGSLVNGPTYSSDNYGSIVFDGVDDHVRLPNGLLIGTGDFTVNQWIKSSASENGGTLFGNYPSGNLQIFFGYNFIGLYLNNATTYLGTSPWNTVLPQFTTSSIMVTAGRLGTSTFVYLNGILQKTGSSNANIGFSTSLFRIGDNSNSSAGEQFNGNVYNTQVYNRALSSQEIQQNFNALRSRYGI